MSQPTQAPPVKKGRGCFFWGCLTCIVLFLIVCVAIFAVVQFAKSQVRAYTDSAPMKLPKVEMADAEYKELQQRVRSFTDALDAGKATNTLTLTERELNALIAKSGRNNEFADRVYVSFEGDQVKGQISIPLPDIPLIGKGRYLNGEATFRVVLTNGTLFVSPQTIIVKGKPVPDRFMQPLKQENFAKDAANDPKAAEAIGKFDSIVIQDGKVIIKPRANSGASPPPP
jgi:hypothetical protein